MDKFSSPENLRSKSLTSQPDSGNVAAGSEGLEHPVQQQPMEREMAERPGHFLIVEKEDFEEAEGNLDHEKIGEIAVVTEEKLPPLREIDIVMGAKTPFANGQLKQRVREAGSAELQQKAAALNPTGGAIVLTEHTEEETSELFRYSAKADVYKEKSEST